MSKPNQVIIEVHGGVAEVVSKPGNIEVILHDYDVDGIESERLKKDADGKVFAECVHRATRRKPWPPNS